MPDHEETTGASEAAEKRSDPLAALLDAFVFAPVGAFLHGPETVGDLAVKGRQDVANARVIGRMALDKATSDGRTHLGGALTDVAGRWVDVLVAAARAAGVPLAADPPTTGPVDRDGPRLRVVGTEPTADVVDDDPATDPDEVDLGAPEVESLAIPGYDTLAASQVVPRLDDLSDGELADVQDYERAHRGRMTILSRIAQLRAS